MTTTSSEAYVITNNSDSFDTEKLNQHKEERSGFGMSENRGLRNDRRYEKIEFLGEGQVSCFIT